MKRRSLNPAGLAEAVKRRVPGPSRRRPTTHVRVYDARGHARTLDPEEGTGKALREAAEELVRALA
jgi:hypothetical protein